MYQLHLLLTSHKGLWGNLQDTHKFELCSKRKFPNVSQHPIDQNMSHTRLQMIKLNVPTTC